MKKQQTQLFVLDGVQNAGLAYDGYTGPFAAYRPATTEEILEALRQKLDGKQTE